MERQRMDLVLPDGRVLPDADVYPHLPYDEERGYPGKKDWGDGPWMTEPDKVVWVCPVTDLDCMIRRGPMGNWCGYLGVSQDHPWFDVPYQDIEVWVHGDLTYGDRCHEDGGEGAICHLARPGRPVEIYWLGFDCGHYNDIAPAMELRMRRYSDMLPVDFDDGRVYRDICFVVTQVNVLGAQARVAQAAKGVADWEASLELPEDG